MHKAGHIAAGTLGYIHGNLPGAYLANNAYSHLTHMPAIPPTPPKTPVKRKGHATGPGYSKRRTLGWYLTNPDLMPKSRGQYVKVPKPSKAAKKAFKKLHGRKPRKRKEKQSTLAGYGAQTIVGSKKLNIKKKRMPKVTKKFKLKVQRALDPNLIHGTYDLTFPQGFFRMNLTTASNNTQHCFSGLGTVAGAATFPFSDLGGWSFLADEFLKAASVLWNGQVSTTGADWCALNQANQLSVFNTKMYIRNSFTTYELKNLTQRVLIIRVWEMATKAPMGYDTTGPQQKYWFSSVDGAGTIALSAAGDLLAANHPAQNWTEGLNDDFTNSSGYRSIGATTAQLSVNTLDLNPSTSKGLKSNFKTAFLREYVMEPGEMVKFKVNGPNNMEFDFAKCWRNNAFMSIQKFSRAIFFTVKQDLAVASSVNSASAPVFIASGRVIDFNPAACLALERKDLIQLQMPETVIPAGQTSALGKTGRRDTYVHDVLSPLPYTGHVATLNADRDNPIAFSLP
nr:MAG: capsid protein [Cressdnaviricota sp.]